MQFVTSYYWGKGTEGRVNQGSLCLQSLMTRKGAILAACVCDGFGESEEGETASGYAVECISNWVYKELAQLLGRNAGKREIQNAGRRLFYRINRELMEYGKRKGIELATTASFLLIWQEHYYIFHVGDSRIYKLGRREKQLTKAHVLREQVLTRCLGIEGMGKPDCLYGRAKGGYLLCSDGFRHSIPKGTLYAMFSGKEITTEEGSRKLREIGRRSRERGEKDSILAIHIQVRRKQIADGRG